MKVFQFLLAATVELSRIDGVTARDVGFPLRLVSPQEVNSRNFSGVLLQTSIVALPSRKPRLEAADVRVTVPGKPSCQTARNSR